MKNVKFKIVSRGLRLIACSLLFFIYLCGCVQMRDYTGMRHGAFCALVDNRLGEGSYGKDYYVVAGGVYFEKGDTKNEIIRKIGLPDVFENAADGYQVWFYKTRNLRLYLEDGRLKFWQETGFTK